MNKKEDCETGQCKTGGCGVSKGLCPGIALVIAYAVGAGVSYVTKQPALQFPIMIGLGAMLILGVYPTGPRWFKRRV